MLLSVHHLSVEFGNDTLFTDVTFDIDRGERVALIGPNGCGKSTLLKCIVKEIEASSGEIIPERDASLGYLSQKHSIDDTSSVMDYALSARPDILLSEERLREMESMMDSLKGDEDKLLKHIEEYHALSDEYKRMGGEAYRSEVAGALKGLGFGEEEFSLPVNALSGGQMTRVALARLLLNEPDLLILDEPINHLDLKSVEWLENFLNGYKKAVLVVAHDRYFLDRIALKVVDLSSGTAKVYKGNYSGFLKKREIERITELSEYEKQQDKIAHEEAVIKKLKSFNREKSIKRAESRMKLLDKMERLDKPKDDDEHISFDLSPAVISGKDVLAVKGLKKSFGEKSLFDGVDFSLKRGEHVAIIGDNGTGKTTLLKIINEKLPADEGTVTLGTNVTIGYYDQELEQFDEDNTLFDEMHSAYPKSDNTRIRNVLAAFLFKGDDVFKQIKNLSGGERGRIGLCKLMMGQSNFLILDEPTNHLDMPSKDILEEALNSFDGTVLYVSHDRYFVNRTADRILELNESGFTEYLGDYDYYVKKRDERIKAQENIPTLSDVFYIAPKGKADYESQKKENAKKAKLKRRLSEVEDKIALLEEELKRIDSLLSDPANATNSAKLNGLLEERGEVELGLAPLYDEWEELESNRS